jgi:hypothetical protein
MAKKRRSRITPQTSKLPTSVGVPPPRTPPPFQSASAAIGIPLALFALGAGLISQSFSGAVILMTISLPLFWVMLYRAYGTNEHYKRHIGIVASLVIYGLMIWWIWVPNSLVASLAYDPGNYEKDQDIYGIKWQPNFSELILFLHNSSDNDLTNIYIYVRADLAIRAAGFAPGINVCAGEPYMPELLGAQINSLSGGHDIPLLKGKDSYGNAYKISCERLSGTETVEVRFAIFGNDPLDTRKHKPAWAKIWVDLMAGYRHTSVVPYSECFIKPCYNIPDTKDGKIISYIPWWDVVGYVAFGQPALLSGLRLGSLQ